MLAQGGRPVEGRGGDDGLDAVEGHAELPVEKDLLQHVDLGVAIQAISGFGCARRLEEPDFVVVAQGARTHAGEPSELLDCVFTAFRGYRLPTRQ